MSTQFDSVEQAKSYAIGMFNVPGLHLEEIEPEPVGPVFADVLLGEAEKPDASEQDKSMAQGITDRMNAQRTFCFRNPDGTEHEFELKEPIDGKKTTRIHITIGPFRDGFDCWISADISPFSHRL